MNVLLDTNVVSEWIKPKPNIGVGRWLADIDEDRIFLSGVTIGEIRHGIEQRPVGVRRTRLDAWLSVDLPLRFDGRPLGVDDSTADAGGRLMALAQDRGRPLGATDGWIAATAIRPGLTLVTRTVRDFESLDSRS